MIACLLFPSQFVLGFVLVIFYLEVLFPKMLYTREFRRTASSWLPYIVVVQQVAYGNVG